MTNLKYEDVLFFWQFQLGIGGTQEFCESYNFKCRMCALEDCSSKESGEIYDSVYNLVKHWSLNQEIGTVADVLSLFEYFIGEETSMSRTREFLDYYNHFVEICQDCYTDKLEASDIVISREF